MFLPVLSCILYVNFHHLMKMKLPKWEPQFLYPPPFQLSPVSMALFMSCRRISLYKRGKGNSYALYTVRITLWTEPINSYEYATGTVPIQKNILWDVFHVLLFSPKILYSRYGTVATSVCTFLCQNPRGSSQSTVMVQCLSRPKY
jgi:hypothetical protein